MTDVQMVRAGVLEVAFERHGTRGGPPVVLLHGFPYDVRAYDEVATILAARGTDVVVPYLRGYGPTHFTDADVLRSGQQAALAHDLHDLIDALELVRPVVGGYDWGGRAACLNALLWPDTIGGLVTVDGYNVQDIATSAQPSAPEAEKPLWYQFYLHSERGHAGLAAHREQFARLLWQDWSPTWAFTDDTFAATAGSFANPDFVDVVVHSYRHRFGLVAGDPAYQASEDVIATQPTIDVPTIVLDATRDGIAPPDPTSEHERHFTRLVEVRRLEVGHNLPQEAPAEFADAVTRLLTEQEAAR